jgi:hypothetical protein
MHQTTFALTLITLFVTGCGPGLAGLPDHEFEHSETRSMEERFSTARTAGPSSGFPDRRVRNAAPGLSRTSTLLTVDPIDEDILEDVIADEIFGAHIAMSNLEYTGSLDAIATFDYTGDDLGLDGGIVLSTGNAVSANGPNQQSQVTTQFFTAGDDDLDASIDYVTFDAASIEFDFETSSSDLFALEFVLGSEEYPEFIGSMFSDAFGIFISEIDTDLDPDIGEVPQNIARMENIFDMDCALVGDEIKLWAMTPFTNPCLYVDNSLQTNNDDLVDVYANLDGDDIEYDGFSRPLRLTIPVQPHAKYHIKIVIADTSDTKFDSGLFIQSGSFHGTKPLPFRPLVDAPFGTKLK